MSKHQKMSPEAVNLVATRFKVLSEPLRLQILQYLENGESSVTNVTKAVNSTQPNVSKHLKILQDEGFVAKRQRGTPFSIRSPMNRYLNCAMLSAVALRNVTPRKVRYLASVVCTRQQISAALLPRRRHHDEMSLRQSTALEA
ncbi:MAG: winged helix-turn-helix transcriptional regulator [Acidobacteria bacterium]|nr:winged helix-turn-helix transcriptional regulator [Acidobacteriota bacterium]